MSLPVNVIRFLLGGLFIFSGFIKLNDPWGTAYKLEEYFQLFSHDIASFFTWFIPHVLSLSLIISALEVILGVALLLKWKMKFTLWFTFILMVFFTFLTFYAWAGGKMKECGCFGDFIRLKAGESFVKDLVLLAMIIFLLLKQSVFSGEKTTMARHILIAIAVFLSFGIGYYAIEHLPYFDFLPFKTGNNIPELRKAEEAPRFVYIVSKDGKQYTFEKYPTDPGYTLDSTYVANADKAFPKISEYTFLDEEGQDYADTTLKGRVLLIIVRNVYAANTYEGLEARMASVYELIRASEQAGIRVMVLTSSASEDFENFRHRVRLAAPYFQADETLLKTMIRSNIGIILLNQGTVKGKWHYNDIPDFTNLKSKL